MWLRGQNSTFPSSVLKPECLNSLAQRMGSAALQAAGPGDRRGVRENQAAHERDGGAEAEEQVRGG